MNGLLKDARAPHHVSHLARPTFGTSRALRIRQCQNQLHFYRLLHNVTVFLANGSTRTR